MKTKFGIFKCNSNQSCLMVGTQKTVKAFHKYYCLIPSTEGQSWKKYDFSEKNYYFTATIFLYTTTWLWCNIPLERTL